MVTVVIAGGWVVEETTVVGPALIVTAIGMFCVWIVDVGVPRTGAAQSAPDDCRARVPVRRIPGARQG
ncbi:hypothetical protein [Micromonospora arida]|uniref:hypothetical protein n=1 Tax=Micromonospora arida TaxID=2203715 RepID=UPI0033A2AD9E